MPAYLIGTDIGTQGTKAVLYDTQLNLVASSFGGGAKSRLFNVIKAEVLGVQSVAREVVGAAPLGSAVLAGIACGAISDYKAAIARTAVNLELIRPNLKANALYGPYAHTYLRMMDALTPIYKSGIYNL